MVIYYRFKMRKLVYKLGFQLAEDVFSTSLN